MTTKFESRLLKVNQVAEMTGCHRNTIWNHIKSGKLPAVRSGRRIVRIQESDVAKFFTNYQSDNTHKAEETAAIEGKLELMKYWSNIGAREERQLIIELLGALKLELINEAKKLFGTEYEESGKKTVLLALGVEKSIIRIKRAEDLLKELDAKENSVSE